jgi:hypothetical protein
LRPDHRSTTMDGQQFNVGELLPACPSRGVSVRRFESFVPEALTMA